MERKRGRALAIWGGSATGRRSVMACAHVAARARARGVLPTSGGVLHGRGRRWLAAHHGGCGNGAVSRMWAGRRGTPGARDAVMARSMFSSSIFVVAVGKRSASAAPFDEGPCGGEKYHTLRFRLCAVILRAVMRDLLISKSEIVAIW